MAPSGNNTLSRPKDANPAFSNAKARRKSAAHAAAVARYRERHRDAVLEAERLRAAHRRKNLTGEAYLRERERAKEASARYRARHREELALLQRQVRKRAYIKKYGIHAYIQRSFDAPIPGREDTPEPEPAEEQYADADEYSQSWGRISDYVDPLLKRW
ncbi:hypothetical protein GGX14DRAFT_401738 [Mycena pura]|uniref:Uncharacterized protein n=1 Tax=Mycena pura TaxID=153505 RepID=A0AAD6V3G3_9AGAR|nr:hypothetical protein GGX14DRAFT_401738 [Mycena pura]